MANRILPAVALALGLCCLPSAGAASETPLHQRIDQLIAGGKADFESRAAKRSSDEEFLRRVYLDLAGTIPTATEARAFLEDTAANKRESLIDRLLASPEHVRHMQHTFDVLLMERRADKHVPRAQWQEYLRASFAANKPWDQLVQEVLSADGTDPAQRPAAKFYLDRLGEPHLLTRDISRLFLGMNLQCAQCHDHPLIDHYKQDHYYGLYAFLNRSFLFADPKTKLTVYAEKAEGDATFISVFDPAKVQKSTGPRMPKGAPIKEPTFDKGAEYTVAPAKDVRPVPKFSRRGQLAANLATAENLSFKRNIANRLWAMLLGRGLIDPIDRDHAANPPSHPELLELLAEEIAARKFDLRSLLREIALSQTYQRSSELPDGMDEVRPETFAVAGLKPLRPEQLAWALLQATGTTDAKKLALGAKLTEPVLYADLAQASAPVVGMFAGEAGTPENQSFSATLNQALFLSNGPLLRTWIAPRAGNLAERLGKLEKPEAIADELYLSVLTRRPTAEEITETADFLKSRADRPVALQDLIWALLASAEFRFNH
ncbi:MAG: DUF1549 domain-containing protein [Planctomycetia bacterium]|nr:DUF1549 domain-containing protein [Planctomycetia bacterium]